MNILCQILRLSVSVCLGFFVAASCAAQPLALHPENAHYFMFRGKPTVLITSGEHYGAVLNREYDFVKYLNELQAHRFNLTRTFTGLYCETTNNPNQASNSLAPAQGQLLCPWARSDQPGYANGGNKFDLTRWDDEFFRRLKKFMTEADRRGIVVEMNIFCPFYEDVLWKLSPWNAANNVNQLGKVGRNDVYTLDKHGGLLALQEQLVRKLASELAEFNNLYYEICNEPYVTGIPMNWQRHMIDVLVAAEANLPHKHLISMNIANGSAKVKDPPPAVSIFNFHYASPPSAVVDNFQLNKVIGCNETGFHGTGDEFYRREAWAVMLAGGGLFNHLDYSFTVGHEGGTFTLPPVQWGGGSRTLRHQLHTLTEFLNSFDFVRMKPAPSIIHTALPKGATAHALAEIGKQYAICVFANKLDSLAVELPQGRYKWYWVDPVSGNSTDPAILDHPGGVATIPATKFTPDAALAIRSDP